MKKDDQLQNIIKECRKKYRLERDLELRPLMEKAIIVVTEYVDKKGCNFLKELREEIYQNIPPLEDNED
jgi:hypothetical protein